MLDASAIPMMTAFDMLESDGRVRSMGYTVVSMIPPLCFFKTHLNNRVAKDWGSNIANQHRSKSSHKHVGDQDSLWLRAGLAKDKCSQSLVDSAFGQSRC